MRPAGIVDRIVRPWRRPGKVRSSMYRAAPVTLSTPSMRSTLRPTERPARGMTAIIATERLGGLLQAALLQAALDHADDGRFLAVERRSRARQLRGARFQRLDRRAVHVGV